MAAEYNELTDAGAAERPSISNVFAKFWPIGILSFGGTQANMAMFYQMLVKDLRWIEEAKYAELLGVVQALPGASAAQIVLAAVTTATGSPLAGLLAFALFCLPGAVGMAILGTYLAGTDILAIPWVVAVQAGIGCAATALVANGAWELGQKLAVDKVTKALWLLACISCYASATAPAVLSIVIIACLFGGGITTLIYYDAKSTEVKEANEGDSVGIARGIGWLLVAVVWILLVVLLVAPFIPGCPSWVKTASIFYKVGCLVFGGGPVVIPLMLLQLVAENALAPHQFLLGFAAVQAFPGPMFNLAAFCGGLMGGWQVALLAWVAIMFPGTLLALGVLPFWVQFRRSPRVQRVLKGVNACAAGLMGSAVLLLWETLVTQQKPRVCLTVCFIGVSQIVKVQAYFLILMGVCAGLVMWGCALPL